MLQQRVAITLEQAIDQVLQTEQLEERFEIVQLMDSLQRYSAEDVYSTSPLPPFHRALYDGFAIRSEDVKAHSTTAFRVIATIGAGDVYNGKVGPFEAVRIMTGAQLPDDCDAVVMLEHVTYGEDSSFIHVEQPVERWSRVYLKGSELEENTRILKKGQQIHAGIIGLLATFGYGELKVVKKPVIGVIATGNELLGLHEPLVPGKIRNSNTYMLLAQIKQVGAEGVFLGTLEDDLEKSICFIEDALHYVDIVVTTGGVSVGDFDYLPAIYERLQARVLFNKIAMRPGSVTTVAKRGKQYLFGLSGNPAASFIGFELLVAPLIRKQLNSEAPYLWQTEMKLGVDMGQPNQFAQIVRVTIDQYNGEFYVRPSGLNMSNAVSSLAYAEGLAWLQPTTTGYKKGDNVRVFMLNQPHYDSYIKE